MRRVPLLLTLAAAMTATAVSQEIVIEPTNGRPQSKSHVSRPATVQSTPVETKKATKSTETTTASKHANPAPKKVAAKQLANSKKVTPAESKPPVSETAANAPAEPAPAPKKMPDRPAWAQADTRDSRSIQTEIASALAHDPKLSNSPIEVKVDDGSVLLQGRAAGVEERLQAERLAQSYAWNRKLVDKITVVSSFSAKN